MDRTTLAPLIVDIYNPLAEGPALLLLPEAVLLRWPAGMNPPPKGATYTGTVVDLSSHPERPKVAELVKTVVCARNPLARCDAARALPSDLLVRFYSYQLANQMQNVSRRLRPEVRERLQDRTVGLKRLVRASYARTITEQIRRCGL